MQGANDFVSLDAAKDGEVGFAVRTVSLQREISELNFLARGVVNTMPPASLGFGTIDTFHRQALEEVVEVLVE